MSSSVAAERASIESAIGDMTLIDILERNAATYPNQPAIHWRDEGSWRSLDWAPEEWSAETGELTPSIKLRRSVVAERYAELIDEMYA